MRTYHIYKNPNGSGYFIINQWGVPTMGSYCETLQQAKKLAANYSGFTKISEWTRYLKKVGRPQEMNIPREFCF